MPNEIYVFGSLGTGHHLYTARRAWEPRLEREMSGLDLDGRVRPYDDPQAEGERVAPMRRPALSPGWSYVSWWDRQGDDRRGSHTGILARGTWTDAQLVAAARRLAPWAIRVPLGSWAGEGGDG